MTTPGALIAGRYRLRTRVASGGMGSVWEAEDEVLGRRVAVKMLLTQPGMSAADADTARSRVIREARITARLHHPHAVTIYDVVQHAGQPCLIMQFVPSRSLNAILQDRGVLPEQLTARIGAELASALTAAHLAGIVHRDIKPSNVLITDDGSAKLTDFGISHAAGDVNLTSTGMVSGTPAYLAPEVARGAPSGFPADVFSLGATLYATLEGMPPFGTDVNPMAVLHRVASGQIVLPRRSGSLTPLLLHMLAPMPGNRPTMSDVARALASPAEGPARPAAPARAVPSPTLQGLPAAALPAGSPSGAGPSAAGPSAAGSSAAGMPAGSAAGSAAGSLAAGSGAASLPDLPGASAINDGARNGGARPVSPGPEHRRPALVGAIVAIVVIGLLALGVALLTRRGSGNVAGTSGSTAPSAASAGARTTPTGSQGRAANPLPVAPGSSAAARSSPGTSGSVAPLPATGNRAAATSRSSSIATGATTSAPKTSAPKTSAPTSTPASSSSTSSTTSSSTTSSSTSSTTSSAGTGAPTAAQLAAAVTDYYAQLPSGTDSGWAHLTDRFRQNIAGSRAKYQSFWDGIESVSVSDVRGTGPGTVRARVSYRLKNGQESVEDTTYQLVSSDGILKIDDQKS